jgi:hypothetical protein
MEADITAVALRKIIGVHMHLILQKSHTAMEVATQVQHPHLHHHIILLMTIIEEVLHILRVLDMVQPPYLLMDHLLMEAFALLYLRHNAVQAVVVSQIEEGYGAPEVLRYLRK